VDVIVENTESEPFVPFAVCNPPLPPAPTVTVIGVPEVTDNPVAVL
jgi:hypothetical protein